MKIKKLLQLGLASVLSVSSLLVISVPAAFAAGPFTCTWTGGGGNNNFSTAGNWSGCNSAAPQPGDSDNLIFPVSVSNLTPQNDLTTPTFGSITFNGTTAGTGYEITGFAMTVHGNITDSSTVGVGTNEINVPTITMSLNSGVISSGSQPLRIGDSVNSGSDVLALGSNTIDFGPDVDVYSNVTGTNTIVGIGSVHFKADNGFSGTVGSSSGATVYADSTNTFANANVVVAQSAGTVSGSGNVGEALLINSGGILTPGDPDLPNPNCLTADNLTVNGTYNAVLGGADACSGYDQITVPGTVDVTSGTLDVSLANGFTPSFGETFTIVNNTGSNPVTSTFTGMAEGSTFTVGNYTFKISYVGGDGNDIVLTDITPDPTSSSSSSAASAPKTPDTGLALVAAHPLQTLAISSAAALSILVIARRLKPAKQ